MFGNLKIIAFTVGCHFLLSSSLFAARPPLSPAGLVSASDLVIVGRIIHLEIGTERSHIERGFGNYDWVIDLTLSITDVEKGLFQQSETIVVRCFRIKTRKSTLEYFTTGGNRPIPAVGTNVRAHLYRDNGLWRVVLPNGLSSLSNQVELTDADAIRQLRRGRRYTYLLPIELWLLIVVIGILLLIVVTTITRLWPKLKALGIVGSDRNCR